MSTATAPCEAERMRVVSLLPSTTEIAFGLGAGDDVVAVTFECDHPPQARTRRVVSSSTMPEGLAPAQIDSFVADALARGEDLYSLDEGALREVVPDVVLTQDLCAVCAIDVSTVGDALDYLGCSAQVVSVDPHSIEEVLAGVETIGRALGRQGEATAWIATLRERLAAVAAAVPAQIARPRVLVLEWTDPPYAPGHWIPEMVEAAGGRCVLGEAGGPSRRVTWSEVTAARADLVVVAPCGYDRDGAQEQADLLSAAGHWSSDVAVLAVDANAHWARPGPRIVDGIEELARAIASLRGSGLTRADPG